MTNICILTDTAVQFPAPAFEGRQLVHQIPLHIEYNQKIYKNCEGIKAHDLPLSLINGDQVTLIPPTSEEFKEKLISLSQKYDEIVVITHSTRLSSTYENACLAAEKVRGQTKIEVIDSQTISTGQGLIVQAAANAAEKGMDLEEVKDLTRNFLPRVYSVFIIQGLSYLENIDVLKHAQAVIGEKFKMLSMFMLDNDVFFSTYKARNKRHIVELFHEFLFEFPNIEHIAFTQGNPPFENETRALRERIAEDFPGALISEHINNAPITAIMGPRTLGMFVMQRDEE